MTVNTDNARPYPLQTAMPASHYNGSAQACFNDGMQQLLQLANEEIT
jgi:hypothetical protein